MQQHAKSLVPPFNRKRKAVHGATVFSRGNGIPMSFIGPAIIPVADIAVLFPRVQLTVAFARCCRRVDSPTTFLCICSLYGLTV